MAKAENAKGTDERPKHKATYATDKRNGGYMIRVIGPFANRFIGRKVPVTMRNDNVHDEELVRLVWSGIDTGTDDRPGTGLPAALYTFKPKPKMEDDEIPF